MSVFDVHINRAPIAGTITRIAYIAGKFVQRGSRQGERGKMNASISWSTNGQGLAVGFTQIAGLVCAPDRAPSSRPAIR